MRNKEKELVIYAYVLYALWAGTLGLIICKVVGIC
jgi:hypothetical protein